MPKTGHYDMEYWVENSSGFLMKAGGPEEENVFRVRDLIQDCS